MRHHHGNVAKGYVALKKKKNRRKRQIMSSVPILLSTPSAAHHSSYSSPMQALFKTPNQTTRAPLPSRRCSAQGASPFSAQSRTKRVPVTPVTCAHAPSIESARFFAFDGVPDNVLSRRLRWWRDAAGVRRTAARPGAPQAPQDLRPVPESPPSRRVLGSGR